MGSLILKSHSINYDVSPKSTHYEKTKWIFTRCATLNVLGFRAFKSPPI